MCFEGAADTVAINGASQASPGESIALAAAFGGADGAVTYNWSVDNAAVTLTVDPLDPSKATATAAAPATAIVTVAANDGLCVGASTTYQIGFVCRTETVTISGAPATMKPTDAAVTLTGAVTFDVAFGGTPAYTWAITGPGTLTGSGDTVAVAPTGIGDIVVTLTAGDGLCQDASTSVTIKVVPGVTWRRGDADGNGKLELTDAVRLLTFLFLDAAKIPPCKMGADSDSNNKLELTDAVRLLTFLFLDSSKKPDGFPGCSEFTGCDYATQGNPLNAFNCAQ